MNRNIAEWAWLLHQEVKFNMILLFRGHFLERFRRCPLLPYGKWKEKVMIGDILNILMEIDEFEDKVECDKFSEQIYVTR